jgi:hypothetical protein
LLYCENRNEKKKNQGDVACRRIINLSEEFLADDDGQ